MLIFYLLFKKIFNLNKLLKCPSKIDEFVEEAIERFSKYWILGEIDSVERNENVFFIKFFI